MNPEEVYLISNGHYDVPLSAVLSGVAMMKAQGYKVTIQSVAQRFNISQYSVRNSVVPFLPSAFHYIRHVPPLPSTLQIAKRQRTSPSPRSPTSSRTGTTNDAIVAKHVSQGTESVRRTVAASYSSSFPLSPSSSSSSSSPALSPPLPSSSSIAEENYASPPTYHELMTMIPDISLVTAAPLHTPPAEISQDTQELWESVLGDAYYTLGLETTSSSRIMSTASAMPPLPPMPPAASPAPW